MELNKRKIVTIALALVTSVSMALGGLRTYAEAPTEPEKTDIVVGTTGKNKDEQPTIELNKVLNAPNAVHLTEAKTFTFNITKYSNNNSTADLGEMPNLTISDITFNDNDLQAPQDNNTGLRTGTKKDLLKVNGHDARGSDFPHAGVYVYKITEADVNGITKDKSVQWLRVYVANAVNEHNIADKNKENLYIRTITVQKDSSEQPKETPSGEKQPNLTFTNEVTPPGDGTLKIKKKLVDTHLNDNNNNFNNETRIFTFNIKFIYGDGAQDKVSPIKINDDGKTMSNGGVTVGKDQDIKYNTEYVFQLTDEGELNFKNLPIGTKYEVKETNVNGNYVPSASATQGGVNVEYSDTPAAQGITVSGDKHTITGTKGKELAANSNLPDNKLTIAMSANGNKENSVTFTNTYDFLVITGVVMNNLPFILMIGVATIGIAAFVIAKRRRYNH